ncbi:DUF6415 family natural product biosynthesis protein [Streptomyces sp. 4F14]|uniref:DUF6415 family natural product biosynthesis protein n=1 Tax=Streptomyces sp. 4F14 TaxID=3394380 RepID=UPI003A8871C1
MANRIAPQGAPRPAGSITPAYEVNRHGTITKQASRADAQPSLTSICAAAEWYGTQSTLLRHGEVAEFGEQFTACLAQLVPESKEMAERLDPGDAEAETALAAVRTARMRMDRPKAPGLRGESERVGDLALSVSALAHHREKLTAALAMLEAR